MASPDEQKNKATKDPVLNAKASNIVDVKLSNDVIAKCLIPKGKHVINVQGKLDGQAENMMPLLMCECTAINGKPLHIEDLKEMSAGDYLRLAEHFGRFLE